MFGSTQKGKRSFCAFFLALLWHFTTIERLRSLVSKGENEIAAGQRSFPGSRFNQEWNWFEKWPIKTQDRTHLSKEEERALSKARKKKSAVRRDQKKSEMNLENTEGLNENTCVQKNTQSDRDNQTRADTMFRRGETQQVNKSKVQNMRGRPGCGESRWDKQSGNLWRKTGDGTRTQDDDDKKASPRSLAKKKNRSGRWGAEGAQVGTKTETSTFTRKSQVLSQEEF